MRGEEPDAVVHLVARLRRRAVEVELDEVPEGVPSRDVIRTRRSLRNPCRRKEGSPPCRTRAREVERDETKRNETKTKTKTKRKDESAHVMSL